MQFKTIKLENIFYIVDFIQVALIMQIVLISINYHLSRNNTDNIESCHFTKFMYNGDKHEFMNNSSKNI